jgi:GH24 family phage-related lysozyme (muramidase)|tara:strand:+ start:50 stop:469 length:420 start_codon:yes stop_codon:yes gene_type:complete
MYEELKEQIKLHEGYRLEAYNCTEGFLTGGYGHKILDGEHIPSTKEGWSKVFEDDFLRSLEGAKRIIDFDTIHPKAQEVCIEAVFVLGVRGFSCFKRTLQHLKEGSYSMASKELKDSLWFKKQATNRVQALCNILEAIK